MKIPCCIGLSVAAFSALLSVQSSFAEGAFYCASTAGTQVGTNWAGPGVTGIWSANANGTTSATNQPAPGNIYTLIYSGTSFGEGSTGTLIREPQTSPIVSPIVFPGDSLILNFNTEIRISANTTTGTSSLGLSGTTATGLALSSPILNFPGANGYAGLTLNGGILDAGNTGDTYIITGTMSNVAGTISYILPGGTLMGAPASRGFILGSQLTGSGKYAVIDATNISAGVQVTNTANNNYNGGWIVQAGWLQGVGDGLQDGYNSLGTNSSCTILVDPTSNSIVFPCASASSSTTFLSASASNPTNCSLLDLGTNIMNSAGTLAISNNGKMWLHGHYIFSAATLEGASLTASGGPFNNGYYPYSYLTNTYKSNFTGLPSVFTTPFSGDITVQPYGAIPPQFAPQITPQPANAVGFAGGQVEFVSGVAPFNYPGAIAPSLQWYTVDSTGAIFTPLANGVGGVSGATNGTLIVASLTVNSETNFALIASNSLGTATSSVVSLTTVYAAPAAIYLDYGSNAAGNGTNGSLTMSGDWNTTGYWWDGNLDGGLPASTLAFDLPGVPFILVTGSELRTPANATATNFPGALLELTGTGTFTLPQPAVAFSNSVMICKAGPAVNSGSFGELYFTNLYISGGQIDTGNNGFTVFDGAMSIGPNNAFFYTDNSGTEDRGYQINSTLSGSGTIEVYLYSAATVFETSYSNNLGIAGANNPFTGSWLVIQGALLGIGNDSLGTNTPITVEDTGALETMYNIDNPNGNLTLNGRMYLHQNDTFSNMSVGGIFLPSGTFSYSTLSNTFGTAYFPPTWNQLNNSTSNTASGSITILGTAGNGAPSVSTPAAQTNFASETALIAGLVAGSPPLTYQWYTLDSTGTIFTPLVNGVAGVTGATNATLSLGNLAMDEATNYVLVVTNLGGATTSSPPTVLTVFAFPPTDAITLNYNGGCGCGSYYTPFGDDWNTPGGWWDGNADGGLSAATLAPLLSGVPFVVPPGSVLRTPSAGSPGTATFPGSELELLGDGNFEYGNDSYTTTSGMNLKGGTGAVGAAYEVRFTNLVINGGQIDLGNDWVGTLDGAISIGVSNALFFMDNSDTTPDDRGLQINSVLSGTGTVQVNMYAYVDTFETAHTNDLDIASSNNPFAGAWYVQQGVLLGSGSNSLGTNTPINVASNGALETMYNINNSNGTLILNGRMFLHQNDTFSNVIVGGTPLPQGTYPYAEFAGLPSVAAYFPANWPQKYGSTVSNASGSITVVGTNGNLAILTQPQSKTLYAGVPAHFSVVASGLPTLSYQWAAGTTGSSGPYTNILGATGTNLTVADIAPGNALDYVVIVANSQGSLTSSPATLTVIPDPTASTYADNIISLTASNLVAYWRFNETSGATAYDYAGGFNGTYEANVEYGPQGVEGPQPPAFPGFEAGTNYALETFYLNTDSYVQVPPLNVNTNALTILAWIYPYDAQVNAVGLFFCRAGTTVSGFNYTTNTINGEYTLGYTWNGGDYTWNSGIVPPQNQWSLAALSVSPSGTSIYLVNANGIQYSNNPIANAVQNFDGVSLIGNDSDTSTGSRTFYGVIDEVSVFNTSLSLSQINFLYGQAVQSPEIITEPSSATYIVGETATFTVVAEGAGTLSYQWQAGTTGNGGPYTNLTNGIQISGATNATLTIQNVSAANALDYIVVITNLASITPLTSSPPATLTVAAAPATITLNYSNSGVGGQLMAGGADWNSTGYWWDGVEDGGQPASALAPVGVPFVVPPGSNLRTPNGATATNFPGAELDLDGNGTFVNTYPFSTSFPGGILVYKGGANLNAASAGEVEFNNLVINGGQIDCGNAGVVVLDGAISIGPNNAYFYVDTTEGANGGDRGFQVNSVISGAGAIQLYLYSGASSFVTTYSNDLDIASSANTFTGPWLVSQGPLLGSGLGSLGTNSITVATNGALETLYNINDPNASLTLNGLMYLHQKDTFQTASVNGTNLYAGTYTAAQLAAAFPANFPSAWTQLYGSSVSTASGTLTVLQPPATPPTLSVAYNPLTLTWSQGTLFEATNLLGPWIATTNPSPYTVSPTNAQMYFQVAIPLLP